MSPSEGGGIKEGVFAIKGDGAYSVFKFEGGTHRVQRVPETESQGRIHTSTATVAVMPEAEEVEVEIDEKDLKIDVYRSSGPGGQSVNTTDSAVRITHLPTGIVGRDAGRALAAPEPRQGDARAPRAALRGRARAAAGRAGGGAATRRSARASAPRRSAPTTIRRTASPTTGSASRTGSTTCSPGELDEFTEALTAEERRRALEGARRDARRGRSRAARGVPRAQGRRLAAARRRAAARAGARPRRGSSSTPSTTGRSPRPSAPRRARSSSGAAGASRSPTCSASGASAG